MCSHMLTRTQLWTGQEQPLPMDDSNVILLSRGGHTLSTKLQQLSTKLKQRKNSCPHFASSPIPIQFPFSHSASRASETQHNLTQALTYHKLLGHTVIHGIARRSSLHERVCFECIIKRVRAALLPLSLTVRPT